MMISQKTALAQLRLLKKQSQSMRLAAEGWPHPWQTLVATMMSAQTRDEVTIVIAQQLFKKYPTLQSLAKARHADVLRVFKSLNYNHTKAKHVIACAQQLQKNHQGRVPESLEALIALPGVGRKTANVFLAEMQHDAIGVDTHVAHIARELGWTTQKDPTKIEADLQSLFPKSKWRELNGVLVRFGKTHQSRIKKKALLNAVRNTH